MQASLFLFLQRNSVLSKIFSFPSVYLLNYILFENYFIPFLQSIFMPFLILSFDIRVYAICPFRRFYNDPLVKSRFVLSTNSIFFAQFRHHFKRSPMAVCNRNLCDYCYFQRNAFLFNYFHYRSFQFILFSLSTSILGQQIWSEPSRHILNDLIIFSLLKAK